jgi:hypothetical protein
MPFTKGDPKAGRPKGLANKGRSEFLSMIREIGKPKELIAKMKELTLGVKCSKSIGDGMVVVYEKPPDAYAISYLLDQAYGKARQSIEVEGKVEVSWEDMFGIGGVNPESKV